jgi:hypothetical protein
MPWPISKCERPLGGNEFCAFMSRSCRPETVARHRPPTANSRALGSRMRPAAIGESIRAPGCRISAAARRGSIGGEGACSLAAPAPRLAFPIPFSLSGWLGQRSKSISLGRNHDSISITRGSGSTPSYAMASAAALVCMALITSSKCCRPKSIPAIAWHSKRCRRLLTNYRTRATDNSGGTTKLALCKTET